MSGGSPTVHPEPSAQVVQEPATPAPGRAGRLPGHEDLPSDAHHVASQPDDPVSFDSPDVHPGPLPPPGASQPNAPLNHIQQQSPAPSHSHGSRTSPLNHKQLKRTQQKFSLLRKKGRASATPSSSSTTVPSPSSPIDDDDDDDEWLLEGSSSNGHVNATVSVGREASNLSRSVDTLSLADSETGEGTAAAPTAVEPPHPAPAPNGQRLSKSRALAKKTSRLFSRNGHHHEESSSSASLTLPGASTMRQNSISSNGSSDSRQKHWSLSRVSSGNKGGSPPPRGSADSSQPSSWHPPPSFALRRTPSSQTDTDVTTPVGVPQVRHRESNSHLSASIPVPTARSINNDLSSPNHQSAHHQPHHQQQHSQASSLQRQDTLPSRMSSWFSNLLPTSTTEQSPSSHSEPTPQSPASPLRKPTAVSSIFSAARNKAVGGMRYLLDSEAQPDHCTDTMWVMGVPHPGFTPDYEESPAASPPSWATRFKEGSGTYSSSPPTRGGIGHFFGSSFNLAGQASTAEPQTPTSDASRNKKDKQKEAPKWPEQFYDDFRSRVWCTYRSQYAPITPLPAGILLPTPETYFGAFVGSPEGGGLPQPGQTSTGAQQPSRLSNGPWSWVKGDERGLTSDAGWGCMLRTGQSLLANALIHHHLGRGWRLPPNKPSTTPESPLELAELEAYATYVRILSWFFDDPSPLCPFSVHRMALIGKELGKEVGEWFGPSTAAGALKTLVNSFPLCGLSVVNAVDGTIYRSDVYAASNISSDAWEQDEDSPKRSSPSSIHRSGWGGKSVLILIGIRLGLDGVNPIYYDSIKTLFTFPHSVGIAGGRPSSSYYFVASQANSLFYLDPHFTRPAIPLRVPPPTAASPPGRKRTSVFHNERDSLEEEEDTSLASAVSRTSDASTVPSVDVVNLDNDDDGATSPVAALQSPSKPRRRLTLTQTLRIKPGTPRRESSAPASPTTPTLKGLPRRTSHPSPSPSRPQAARHSTASSSSSLRSRVLPVDPQTAWYASAYSEANLKTFHCDKIKKLPLSGLDPSMLLGFLCQTEAEFEDFCNRVAKLPQKIFAVQDEPPLWSEDEDGLESVSEPVSDVGSDVGASDKEEEPDLDMDDLDEFGGVSRPLGPKRDDTITPLTAAAAGLRLDSHRSPDDADDADTEEEAETAAIRLARRARRPSAESQSSSSSQRRIPKDKGKAVNDSTVTSSTSPRDPPPAPINTNIEMEPSDEELVPTPIARITRPVAAATPPRPIRPSRLAGKVKRKPPQEIHVSEPEAPILPPPRANSLRAKASIGSLNSAAAVDIPAVGAARGRATRDEGETELLNASDDDTSTSTEPMYRSEHEGDGELRTPNTGSMPDSGHKAEHGHEREYDSYDPDPDMSFEDVDADLASTPSSQPVLVERPPPGPF